MATREEIREGIKEWVLEIRQYLCNTESAPEPFTEPIDPEVLITVFPNKLLNKLHSQGVVIKGRLLTFEGEPVGFEVESLI